MDKKNRVSNFDNVYYTIESHRMLVPNKYMHMNKMSKIFI